MDNSKLDPKLIIKYIFKSTPEKINLYLSFFNLVQLYNGAKLIENLAGFYDISKYYRNNSNNHNNVFLYFILYSEILRYQKPQKNILDLLISKSFTKNNSKNLTNISSVYKHIYCYSLKHLRTDLFIDLRDELVRGSFIYFQLLYNKLSYLKDILTKEHIDKLVTFNNTDNIDNYIIKLVFKKKNILFLKTDSKLISILMGVSNKIIVKHCKDTIIYNDEEFIRLRDSIFSENIESSEQLFSKESTDTIAQNFCIINPEKLFLHILNLYFDTFFTSFINQPLINKIFIHLDKIFDKNDRHSITLRKFKDYFIDPSFKE